MGCRESKIKQINLNTSSTQNGGDHHIVHEKKMGIGKALAEHDDGLPNRLLSSAMAVSDLGDSLDSRRLGESFNKSGKKPGRMERAPDSADSTDSGFDDYDEEYGHIITEKSSAELVRQVESDFKPVDLPELLVITGRACTRTLSGYQKNKMEEARILDALREEGLLAKPKGKTSGGMSFEVVDASVINSSSANIRKSVPLNDGEEVGRMTASSSDAFVSSNFMPRKKLERLESRRVNLRKPSARIDLRLAEAEERRKAVEEEKVKMVIERTGLERHGRMKSASAQRTQERFSATVAKRQQHLEEMRDKLKEKHKKNELVRLKHSLNMESGTFREASGKDSFFDD